MCIDWEKWMMCRHKWEKEEKLPQRPNVQEWRFKKITHPQIRVNWQASCLMQQVSSLMQWWSLSFKLDTNAPSPAYFDAAGMLQNDINPNFCCRLHPKHTCSFYNDLQKNLLEKDMRSRLKRYYMSLSVGHLQRCVHKHSRVYTAPGICGFKGYCYNRKGRTGTVYSCT